MLPIVADAGFTQAPTNLSASQKIVDKDSAWLGDELTYDLYLTNSGDVGSDALSIQDAIPAGTEFVPESLSWDQGTAWYDSASDTIYWDGTVDGDQTVHIQYKVRVVNGVGAPYYVINQAEVSGSTANALSIPNLTATTYIQAIKTHLPLVLKN